MEYTIYPDYKESKISWIGIIPKEWEIHRLKVFIPSIQNGQWGEDPDDKSSMNYIVLRVADFLEYTFNLNKDLTVRKIKNTNIKLTEGDLVIEKSGGGEKQLVGRVVQLKNSFKNNKYTYSNFLGKLEIIDRMDKTYINYYFKNLYNARVTYNYIKQTTGIQNLDVDSLIKNEYFSLPVEKKEQEKISNFLDKKIAEIDNLIKKDKKLIELLQEKRTALINQVVTKGINPNARMKDSGIEWIGEIPKDWEIHRLKYISSINRKKLNESTKPDFKLNYLDISNVNSRGEILNIEELFFQDSPSRARRITKKGDTIISTVRTYLKTICYLEKFQDNLIVSTGFAVLNPNKSIESKYLYYSILSEYFVQSTISLSKGVAYPAINPSDLGGIYVLQPKIEEQQEIVNYLDKQTSKIDKAIQKIQQKINLLEEYKKSLIHHVVTGKADVRGVEI